MSVLPSMLQVQCMHACLSLSYMCQCMEICWWLVHVEYQRLDPPQAWGMFHRSKSEAQDSSDAPSPDPRKYPGKETVGVFSASDACLCTRHVPALLLAL